MDKFSYAIGLGIGQNLLSMGAKGIAVDDFAQAIKDVLEGNQTAISHTEARDIVNKYFAELEEKMNAANIEAGKKFLEENKKREGVVTLPSGLQYEVITEGNVGHYAKATDQVQCHYEGTLIDGTLFEAARMDGANRWKQIWHVTLPGLLPTIVLMLILRVGNILNAGFEQILVFYNPSVYSTADIIDTYVYRMGLGQMDFSLSSAMSLFNSVVAFILIVGANAVSRKLTERSIW